MLDGRIVLDELLRHWPDLALVYFAFIVAVASPGPSNLVVMATSMERGRHAGLILALGVTAGSLSWGCLLYTSPSPRDKRQSRMPSSA